MAAEEASRTLELWFVGTVVWVTWNCSWSFSTLVDYSAKVLFSSWILVAIVWMEAFVASCSFLRLLLASASVSSTLQCIHSPTINFTRFMHSFNLQWLIYSVKVMLSWRYWSYFIPSQLACTQWPHKSHCKASPFWEHSLLQWLQTSIKTLWYHLVIWWVVLWLLSLLLVSYCCHTSINALLKRKTLKLAVVGEKYCQAL